MNANCGSMNSVLNDVYVDTISMDDIVTRKAKRIVETFVLDTFIRKEMRNVDPLFNVLFQEVFFSGSFYDGLRVGEATEFDLNIIIKLPFCSKDFELLDASSQDANLFNIDPAFSVYLSEKPFDKLMPSKHPRYNVYKNIKYFFEDFWYSGIVFREYRYIFRPDKLRHWFEGVVIKAKNALMKRNTRSWLGKLLFGDIAGINGIESKDISFKIRKSGPALTLNIMKADGFKIDVDLVPVLKVGYAFLVPKPYPKGKGRLWRLSYPLLERNIIHGKSCAKQVIKLLKRFRDMQGAPWVKLSSYYLKTIVMLELRNSQHWYDGKIDEVFIGCLKTLLCCLRNQKIPFYFDSSCILLSSLGSATICNMEGRLKRVLRDIETNPPQTLRKYFVMDVCCTETINGEQPSSCILM